VENVTELITDRDAFGWLLGDLAELRFDAEWGVLSACSVGAPHVRQRLFIVAYPDSSDGQERLGIRPQRSGQIPDFGDRARAWRDRVIGSLETSRTDGREIDGSARRMVAAGGNAVVPQVAEHIGRLILAADSEVAA
jgi:DNA (cytosine-5)-methyltransferase 1